jgi:hypothetical protein
MYCPRCGQQQISDEMKFCSRCGLPMSGLTEWLAGGGVPAGRERETQVSLRSPRQKGIRRAAKLMFLSGVMFPIFLVLSLVIEEGAPMIAPIIIFFVALIMMLYARLFSEEISPIKTQHSQTSALGAMSGGKVLPPASNIPIHGPGNLAGQRIRTKELAQPPSVTEHTTNLLDKE